jgi:hypothetical protein
MDSDTDLMVLSFVPSTRAAEPLTIEEAHATAQIVERLHGTHRLYVHGRVNPNLPRANYGLMPEPRPGADWAVSYLQASAS